MRSPSAILALGLAVIAPLLLFTAVVVWVLDDYRRGELEEEMRAMVRAASLSVDRELVRQLRPLELLGALSAAEVDNVHGLYGSLSDAQRTQPSWLAMGLIDARSNSFVFHTQYPLGVQPLPPPRLDPVTARVLSTRRAVIGGVLPPGGPPGRSALIMRAPVFKGNDIRYVISLALGLEGMASVLASHPVPESWVFAVIDPELIIAARSRDAAAFLGQRVTPTLEAQVLANREGCSSPRPRRATTPTPSSTAPPRPAGRWRWAPRSIWCRNG
ncbi:hypothetical protein [Azospirillum thermophilum]|uniref:hypothetical protein n=1 Tax=Azospirillum thermophilum TaxID=2202148 RepID=UPI001FEBDC5C|nr:hypothetical protein [Azospirillum thermophilum]